MGISGLQKHILRTCAAHGGRAGREVFIEFYEKDSPKHDDQVNAITKALERLIDRELLTGYGIRTPHKWYIKEVRLTSKGKKVARKLFGEQQILPLKTHSDIR